MKASSRDIDNQPSWPSRRRAPQRQRLALAALAASLGAVSGCARDVAMQNPRTGETEICRESAAGLNPWSQKIGCVAEHVAQGWTRSDPE